jgi:hypothetical protein
MTLRDVTESGEEMGGELLSEYIECACSGVMACSTCHVIVDPHSFALVGPPDDAEEVVLPPPTTFPPPLSEGDARVPLLQPTAPVSAAHPQCAPATRLSASLTPRVAYGCASSEVLPACLLCTQPIPQLTKT